MSLTLNDIQVRKVRFNGDAVKKVFCDNVKVYSAAPQVTSYLTFDEKYGQPFTLKTANLAKNWDGNLYYSTDAVNWDEWEGEEISSSDDGKLYLGGKNNTYIAGDENKRFSLTSTRNIRVSGNIETLLDYDTVQNGEHPIMAASCYSYMFSVCHSLTSAPSLPATTLAISCYFGMFDYCSGLTSAPSLPATTLAASCYSNMFSGCTKITSAPSLPATTLAFSCYKNMFFGCSGLTSAPSLPATTLTNSCYNAMFLGCTSLTSAPRLPATTLATYCYSNMFDNCKSLRGTIHCARSTSSNSYRLTYDDIEGSSATIAFDI